MQRHVFLLLLFCLSFFSSPVLAQQTQEKKEKSFVLQRFRPSFDPDGIYNSFGGEALGQWRFLGGFWANFAYEPLILTGGKQGHINIVDWHLAADIGGGIGLLDKKWFGLDFYLSVPVTLYMKGAIPGSLNCGYNGQEECPKTPFGRAALGDITATLKWRILGDEWHGIGLSLVFNLLLPTGDKSLFNSEGTTTIYALLALSKHFDKIFRIVGNLGIRTRPEREFLGLHTANELTYQLGAAWAIAPDKFELMAEAGGSLALASINVRNTSLELLAGLKYYPLDEPTLALHFGGGMGVLPGYGMPLFRVFVGLIYTAKGKTPGDRDEDGIPDLEDNCPDQPGVKRNHGCPADRDKDGIIDKLDRCPDVPGPKENQGCPYGDRDNDGIKDNEDQCPDQAGPADNNGCPYGDKDGDGLKDNLDQCPDKAGPKENQGCPDLDRDQDTVVDRKDKCPDIPGPASNNGCPKKLLISVNKKTHRILLLEKVYFATGRAKIRRRSYPVLNQVVAVLKSNPKMRMRIEGHTDSRGSARMNRRLSQRRANAVRRYLIRKGIAPERLIAKGYGEDRPIASNKTRSGRSKNRRVEFHILD